MSSESDHAKESEKFLTDWVQRFESIKAVAPEVQRHLESVRWLVGARDLLAGAPQEITAGIDRRTAQDFDLLKTTLPQLTDYTKVSRREIIALGSSMVTTHAMAFTALGALEGSPGALLMIEVAVRNFEELQQSQGRVGEARARLEAQFPSLVGLFDLAEQAFRLAKLNDDEIPSAAGQMRTFLDKLKGELFDKARRGPNEKNMTWPMMAERLGGTATSQQTALLDQEVSRGPLIEDLSELLKRRTAPDVKMLSVAWTRVVDHVFAVCGCI